jgi:Lon protease-like protein
VSNAPLEIPIFPLPAVVLFPGAMAPLFVFEPRYRQMITDALAGSTRRIGVVAVPEAHHLEMDGDPPISLLGCEGEIASAEQNADGTWRVLLRGTRRIRIVDEQLPDGERLYRLARVETVPDRLDDADREAIQAGRSELLELLRRLVDRTAPSRSDAVSPQRFDGIEDDRLVNMLAQGVDLELSTKQLLLELDSVRDRQRMLCDLLRFRIAELDGGSGPGPTTVH